MIYQFPGIITSKTQALYGRRPRWPYALNQDSWQAEGLVTWIPFDSTAGAIDLSYSRKFDQTPVAAPEFKPSDAFGTVPNLNGSSQYFKSTVAPITDFPLTFSCWFRVANITADHGLVTICDPSVTTRSFTMYAAGSVASDPLRMYTHTGGAFAAAGSAVGFSANTWQLATGSISATTARNAYLNGQNKGTNATSITSPSGISAIGIGAIFNSAPSAFSNGYVCDARIWNRVLTDAEVFALYDPKTRWDLYYELNRIHYSFVPQVVVAGDRYAHRQILAGVG